MCAVAAVRSRLGSALEEELDRVAEEVLHLFGSSRRARGRDRRRGSARRARGRSITISSSRGMRPSFRSENPDWRSPNTSPAPRISRSRSASRKPSVDAAIAAMRACASGVCGSAKRKHHDCAAAAADAAAQLVQLREAEAIGVLDDHHRRVRHVDADLDHGRRDEHVDLAAPERVHHRFLLARRQLAVQQPEPQPRELLLLRAARTPRSRPSPRSWRCPPRAGTPRRPACPPRPRRAASRTRASRSTGFGPTTRRGDRRAPGRHLAQLRLVEVAVDEHRRGARDRRGRHHEHVGLRSFARRLLAPGSSARCSTPKRCCSSITTTPSRENGASP